MKTIATFLVTTSMMIAGCASSADMRSGPGNDEVSTFMETVIHVDADGTRHVDSHPITLEQELADNAAREKTIREGRNMPTAQPSSAHRVSAAGAVTETDYVYVDRGCGTTDLWLYDQPGRRGNRICYAGTGIEDLRVDNFVCRIGACESVANHVASFWAGADSGTLVGTCDQYFDAWEPGDTDGCGQTAQSLWLGHVVP